MRGSSREPSRAPISLIPEAKAAKPKRGARGVTRSGKGPRQWSFPRRATVTREAGQAPQAASVLLPTTALALRVLAPPKFVLVAELLRANGRSEGRAAGHLGPSWFENCRDSSS